LHKKKKAAHRAAYKEAREGFFSGKAMQDDELRAYAKRLTM